MPDTAPPNAVLFWNDVALDLNAIDHTVLPDEARAPGPTASAYMLGLAHLAMADACSSFPDVPYDPFKRRAEVDAGDSKKAAIGGAAFGLLGAIYQDTQMQAPAIRRASNAFLSALRGQPDGDIDAGWDAGIALGEGIAETYWSQDRIREATGPDDYVPQRGEHDRDPENPEQSFYGVLWSDRIPTLVLNDQDAEDASPPEPPVLTDPTYAEDWEEVRLKGEREAVDGTTAELIGLFWAYDGAREIGTPPRLYNQHVRQIGREDRLRPGDEESWARLLALCNLAMADAGWVCWKSKWEEKVWRPIRGIRNVDNIELPPALTVDREWKPYGSPRTNPADMASVQTTLLGASQTQPQFTPDFPAYTSGHATFGGACFTALRLFRAERGLGNGDKLPGNSLNVLLESDELKPTARDHRTGQPRPNHKRRFRRIQATSEGEKAIIDENAESRIFLGVHWRFDSTNGVGSGVTVGERVFDKAYTNKGQLSVSLAALQGDAGSAAQEVRAIIRDVIDAAAPNPDAPKSGKLFPNGINMIELEVSIGSADAPLIKVKGKIQGPDKS
jgi:hypothetical protein